MKYSEVLILLEENNISVKKYYGQNFLIDDNIINNIVTKSNIDKDTNVIEIGPGLGSLTDVLCKTANKVLCYEIDSDMVKILNNRFKDTNVIIKQEDFLKANIDEDISKYFDNHKVVVAANLPYYITTPILLKILEESKLIKQLTVMVQKEVGDRICGTVKTKDYNALSVLVQYYTIPETIINVNQNSFYPKPDVASSVLLIKYREELSFKANNESFFKEFNRNIFKMRRKTLINNLKTSYKIGGDRLIEFIKANNLKESVRSEELSVEQIVSLANNFEIFLGECK